MVKKSILDMIGNTPIYQIKGTNIYAKLEYFNPTGSVKDRAAKQMILDAIDQGFLKPGATIIEPTSGNTGIGLAAIGASLGYPVVLTMPETMSEERKKILKAYGAKLVLTAGQKGMLGAIEKANELVQSSLNAYMPSQFTNASNVKAHYLTTGPEIWEDMDHEVDIFVAGIGTGGTITGTGKYLKEKNPQVMIVGVEPASSPFLSKGYSGVHKIQGIGAGFKPSILDDSLLDEVITVTDEDAIEAAQDFGKQEGIFVGISSGAALYAAIKLSKKYKDKRIVVVLPDSGDRYLSTNLV